MKRALLAGALAHMLVACAGLPDDLAAARDSWHGASLHELEKAWGPPVRVRRLDDGAQEITWVSESYRKVAPSAGVVFGTGGVAIGANVPFGNAGPAVRCDRTMVLRSGAVVEGGRWMGPYDYCNTFRR